MAETRRMDALGRVVVPRIFKEVLGWGTDTAIDLEMHGDKVILTKSAEQFEDDETSPAYKY